MPKATDAEIEQRIESIVAMILVGKTRTHIVRYCSELGVGERQAEEYSRRAWERIREANDGSREDKVTRHLKRLDELAELAKRDGQYSAAMKAYELQAKIMGIELAPMEQEKRIDISDDVLDQVLEETRIH